MWSTVSSYMQQGALVSQPRILKWNDLSTLKNLNPNNPMSQSDEAFVTQIFQRLHVVQHVIRSWTKENFVLPKTFENLFSHFQWSALRRKRNSFYGIATSHNNYAKPTAPKYKTLQSKMTLVICKINSEIKKCFSQVTYPNEQNIREYEEQKGKVWKFSGHYHKDLLVFYFGVVRDKRREHLSIPAIILRRCSFVLLDDQHDIQV